jgi:hypothetical protein
MSGKVCVWARADSLVVVAQGGGGGLHFDTEPVIVVAPVEAPAAERAVAMALEASRRAPTDFALRPQPSPLLRIARVRSWKAFYESASACCFLYEENALLMSMVQLPARDGRGFEPNGEDPVAIDTERLGEAVIARLRAFG